MNNLEVIGRLYLEIEKKNEEIEKKKRQAKMVDKQRQRLADEALELRSLLGSVRDAKDSISCVKYYKKVAIKAGSSMSDEDLGRYVREIVKERRGEK